MNETRLPRGERLAFVALLAIILALTLFPFLWMLSTSFKVQAEIRSTRPTLLPEKWTIANYRDLLAVFPMVRHLINSLLYAGGVTLLSLACNSLAAFAFACLAFPGRERLFALLVLTMMVPMQVTLMPLFLVLKYLGLLNTLAGLVLPGGASVLGIFLMRQFMKDLPQELLEQARLDGCSEFDLFWRVVLPLCKPILASLGVFTFVGAWNELLGPLVIMLRESGFPLPVALATLSSEHGGEWGMMMAGAVLAVIPSLLVFVLAQQHYLKGITAGAVR
ncbi:MAG: N-Acetyl-D-glucosamine ABC transport system, permease protein 2 [Candidatus Ozemobacter sibiricus]|jgi:multiple sugar transport system permease protein|uniref:N-Acetyl-D-glucosamine ABC transport system, permease protein 2 n=1 Tax=Candidatus Ozemobacter sibiricus TaxID=2268124 RepID=A0A367ZS29_9BACT|nr:MAG: N-Acetyl-D-glucosamine ABC transport system, permease protein 2 [Candidatus Ozemobacter sibiricus]